MITLTNCSRVPISTGTLGTVMCWDFFSFRASLQGISHAGIQKGLIALSSQASGLVKTKDLEKGHLVPRCGLGGMGFFFLFSLLFPGIPEL